MVPPPGWFKEPKLSGLNTLGALLWDGGLKFRGSDVFCRLPWCERCLDSRGGVTSPQLVNLPMWEAAGARWDLGGVIRPEKDAPISSSNW